MQATHECRSSLWGWGHRTCPSSPSGHRDLASRDRELWDLPVGGKEMNTHGGGQGLAKEAEIIFGDQERNGSGKGKLGQLKPQGQRRKLWMEKGRGNHGQI